MSADEPARAGATGPLTPLPRLEDLPLAGEGFDRDRVSESFDQVRRHVLQLQAQLRVLQAAGSSGRVEPTGHAVRMDALHLIRAAAEFADQIERDEHEPRSIGPFDDERLDVQIVQLPLSPMIAGPVARHPHQLVRRDDDLRDAGLPGVVCDGWS